MRVQCGTLGVQWGYRRGTGGVHEGYSGGTGGVQWGYSGGTEGVQCGTLGVQWGYSRGTVGVQCGTGEKHKTIQHWYTFFIFIVTSCTQYNKRTWYDMLYMLYFL